MSVKLRPQFYFDPSGKPQTVLLSFEEYRSLLEELEDAEDLKTLDEAIANSEGTIEISEFFAELDAEEQ